MTELWKPRAEVRRITDFEASMLIIERNVAQFKANRIDELLNEYRIYRQRLKAQA